MARGLSWPPAHVLMDPLYSRVCWFVFSVGVGGLVAMNARRCE